MVTTKEYLYHRSVGASESGGGGGGGGGGVCVRERERTAFICIPITAFPLIVGGQDHFFCVCGFGS